MNYEAIVEIPKGTCDKYELDKDGVLTRVGRFCLPFPANYGSVVDTWAEDEDFLDVIIPGKALIRGTRIPVRPIGVLHMIDNDAADAKIVGLPVDDISYRAVRSIEQLRDPTQSEIVQFLQEIKDYAGDVVTFNGWGDVAAAELVINSARSRYKQYAHRI